MHSCHKLFFFAIYQCSLRTLSAHSDVTKIILRDCNINDTFTKTVWWIVFLVLPCRSESYKKTVTRYHNLLGDIVPDIPSSLLAELLHEELTYQKKLEHFQPATTGGALAYTPNPECQNEAFLIYPSGEALNNISILFLSVCPSEYSTH